MSDLTPPGTQNASLNWLLAAGVFIAAAGAGFLLIFGVLIRGPLRLVGWQLSVPLLGLLVGGIFIGVALSKRMGRSTIVPALVSLVCALLLTGGAGFGYVATCNYEGRPDPSNGTFFVLALIGVIFCAVSVIWLFVAIIVRALRKRPGLG